MAFSFQSLAVPRFTFLLRSWRFIAASALTQREGRAALRGQGLRTARVFVAASFPLEENTTGCVCLLAEHGVARHQ